MFVVWTVDLEEKDLYGNLSLQLIKNKKCHLNPIKICIQHKLLHCLKTDRKQLLWFGRYSMWNIAGLRVTSWNSKIKTR